MILLTDATDGKKIGIDTSYILLVYDDTIDSKDVTVILMNNYTTKWYVSEAVKDVVMMINKEKDCKRLLVE